MTDSKSTKRSLAASIGCIALCVVMLIGTTFAWFTDTASTKVNSVTSGTLGIELLDAPNGKKIENTTLQFVKADGADQNEAVLWEPGCTYQLQDVYVHNTGNLAAKYKIEITGITGNAELNKAIEWTITAGGKEADLSADRSLAAGAYETLTIKGHMRDDAGNDYQGKFIDGITITVSATQDTVESDSNNNQYDAKAEYATPVSTAAELQAALDNGEDVVLKNNIEMTSEVADKDNGAALLNLKQSATIYGNGKYQLKFENTVKDNIDRVISIESNNLDKQRLEDITLTLSGVDIVGPTGNGYNRGITAWGVKNLNIIMDNCTASANHYALNIASNNSNVNVTVRNTTLTGYAAFQTWSSGTNATFENCTLTGLNQWAETTPSGDNDYAAIVVMQDAKDSNLTFKNCRIVATEQDTANERFLSVRANATVTFDGCTFIHNNKEIATLDDILDNFTFSDKNAKVSVNGTEIVLE